MQLRSLIQTFLALAPSIYALAADPPKPPTFALIQTWAGPDAITLAFTQDKVTEFLKARKADLKSAAQPLWSSWLKGLASSTNPSLKTWALARCVEAGNYNVYPELQEAITEHLLGISKPGSGRSDRIVTNPPWVEGIAMPDALRIDHESIFWSSLRKTIQSRPDRKLNGGLYPVWCYGTHPDQRDLILELAAQVEAPPSVRNMNADSWNDPRLWIVLDWAMAWGTREDFAAIRTALKEGLPKTAFDHVARTVEEVPGFFVAIAPAVTDSTPATATAPPENLAKDQPVHFDFSQIKILEQPPAPRYPEEAKLRKMMTHLVLTIVVDPQGRPVACRPSPGPWLGFFAPTGVSYGMRWRFKAAELNGVPQYARFRLTMPFRLRN